jgi:HEAT repeat protein
MSKKNTPAKTRQRTLIFAAMFLGFLGTGIFAGVNVFPAYQKNQDFSQVDAEEKFSRLPQYLLNDRALLKDKDFTVRGSAARAMGDLRLKESTVQLTSLLKAFSEYSPSVSCFAVCPVVEALIKLEAKETIPQLEKLLNANDLNLDVKYKILQAVNELQVQEPTASKRNIILYKNTSSKVANLYSRSELDRYLKTIGTRWFKDSEYDAFTSELLYVDSDTCEAINKLVPTIQFTRYYVSDPYFMQNALDKLQAKKIVPQFIESLNNPDIHIRLSAAHVLSDLQAQEAIPKLIILLNESNGTERYKILESLIALDGLEESQVRKEMLQIIQELEGIDEFSDPGRKSAAINTSTKIYLKYNQKLKESPAKRSSVNQLRSIRDQQWILTISLSATSSFLSFLTLFCLRQVLRIGWNGHLICYFPEEVVGELIAFRHELIQEKKPMILIETTLLCVVFTLIWAFYIQINIENLWLPSKDQRRR